MHTSMLLGSSDFAAIVSGFVVGNLAGRPYRSTRPPLGRPRPGGKATAKKRGKHRR